MKKNNMVEDELRFFSKNVIPEGRDIAKTAKTPTTSEYNLQKLYKTCYPDEEVLSRLAAAAYENDPKNLPVGWILLKKASNKNDGYFGAAYYHSSDNQLVIAHRGTKNWRDGKSLSADIGGVARNNCREPRISSAITFCALLMSELENAGKKVHLSITGHSLGGWLARITTFTLKYLRVQKNKKGYTITRENEGYHAHTVVFDSPGCFPMLKRISEKYYHIYENRPEKLIDLLDITVYLSHVNLVNACNQHIGTIFRIYPKDEKFSKIKNRAVHTLVSHDKQHFVDFFTDSKMRDRMKKVKDWPYFKFPERPKEKCNTIFGYLDLIKKTLSLAKDYLLEVVDKEFQMFFKLANEYDTYDPKIPEEENYENGSIKFHYKIIPIERIENKTSVFTAKELIFLKYWRNLIEEGAQFAELNSFLEVQNYAELLPDFEINGEKIECKRDSERDSKEDLKKIIHFTKQLFFFRPETNDIMKKKIIPKVFEGEYRAKSEDYTYQLETNFGKDLHFKDKIKLRGFLHSTNENIWYLFSENTSLEALRIHRLLEIYKEETDRPTEYTNENCNTFLNWIQLMMLNEYVSVIEIFKSNLSKIDNFFVIECDEINKQNIQIINQFAQIQSQTKKIIFIIPKKFKKLFWAFPEKYQKDINLSFDDFDKDSQKSFLEKEFMKSGNKRINLQQLLKIDASGNLSEEQLNIIKDVFDIQEIVKIIKDENYTINLTADNQLYNHLEVSIVNIHKDIESGVLMKFLQKELRMNQKDIILFITGMKGENDTSEFLNYLTADFEDKLTQLIQTKQLILKKKTNYKSESEYYRGLCSEYPKKLIYWLRLNYDRENTIKILEAFDSDLYIKRKFCYQRSHHRTDNLLRCFDKPCYLIFYNVDDFLSKTVLSSLYRRKLLNNTTVTFAKSEDDANELFEARLHLKKSVHLLEGGVNRNMLFQLKKFSGSIKPMYYYSQFATAIFLDDENFLWSDERIKIISDEPGMGKSTVLNNMLTKLIQSSLAIRINLKDVKYEQMPEKNDDKGIFKFLMTMSSNSETGSFANLFKKGLTSNYFPVFILFDAFDEIQGDKYSHEIIRNGIIDLFKYLKDATMAKIIITTRKYERNDLEYELLTFAAKFKKTSEEKQLEYLKKFWLLQILLELNVFDHDYESKLMFYINELLEKTNGILGKEFSQWMGIPLQMKMLAQIYVPTVDILQKSKEDVKNSFDKIRNVFDLYHEFFKKKIDIYYKEKKNWENMSDDEKDSLIVRYYDHHITLSFNIVFPKKDVSLKDSQSLTKEIKKTINRIGIFQITANGEVEFIHRTFVEYFVAYKLADWFRFGGDIFKSNHNIIQSIFFGDKCKIIRKFLDNADLSCNNVAYFSELFSTLRKMEGAKPPTNENTDQSRKKLLKSLKTDTLLYEKSSTGLIQFLFQVFTYWNIKGYEGVTLLHLAALSDCKDIVQRLIELGGNVNEKNEYNETLLHFAAEWDHTDVVMTLIEAGANVNERNYCKYTALFFAVVNGNQDMVNFLIKTGANVNENDQDNNTPLHLAVQKGYEKISQLLIKAGANVNGKGEFSSTPLHLAAEFNRRDIVQLLIDAKANVNVKDDYESTPLSLAVRDGHKDIARLLIIAGANVNEKCRGNKTPLQLAAQKGYKDIIQSLIDAGANANDLIENTD